MKFYNKKIENWVFGVLAACILLPAFGIGAIWVASLDCGSDKTKTVRVTMPGHTVSARDTASATNAYAIYAGGQSGVTCSHVNNCSPASCIPYATGVGGAGTYPTPTHNTATGTFRFPEFSGNVTVRCDCYTDATTVYIDVYEGDFFPIDPIIDNEEEDDELKNRNKEIGENISIYPNPSQDRLNLDFKNVELDGDFKVTVYDGIGNVIETRDIEISGNSSDIFEIETMFYQSGIYYMAISNEHGVVSKSKFIVAAK